MWGFGKEEEQTMINYRDEVEEGNSWETGRYRYRCINDWPVCPEPDTISARNSPVFSHQDTPSATRHTGTVTVTKNRNKTTYDLTNMLEQQHHEKKKSYIFPANTYDLYCYVSRRCSPFSEPFSLLTTTLAMHLSFCSSTSWLRRAEIGIR